ncbi:MAG: nucleotide exchange factor GrpE [Clostridiales bacterium]|nr:nucleotide exchange factor GrpE [Clostridiales bacterium]
MEENKKEFDESIVEENASGSSSEEEQQEEVSEETVDEAVAEEEKEESGESTAGGKKKSARALEIELKKSQEKVADLTDKYQRLMAEFENARKRTAKEQSRMYDVGAKEVLAKLLPVVDNFERGLDALSDEEKEDAFAQGIEKIYQQLMAVFEEIGVKAMDAAGKEFDPEYHNAVMHVEDEELGENLVVEEFQKGYMYKDSVLRHSMVKVAN